MKLKLTHSQFLALLGVFNEIMGNDNILDSMEAKLLHSILAGIFKKLYTKAIEKKKKYSISLTSTEALAFWIFFSKWQVPVEMPYEANLFNIIKNSIHQKFS